MNSQTMQTEAAASESVTAASGKKQITLPSELIWLISLVIMAFAVAMVGAADFGYSSVVAPSFVFSQGVGVLTFGQSEYVVQGILFILLCVIVRKVKLVYFSAFGTCLVYGLVLDLWRAAVPLFNPALTVPGSMAMPWRILLFAVGVTLTAFAVALGFHSYLLPQVNDFFVKGITTELHLNVARFKTAYDLASLAVALALSYLFFGSFFGHGIGVGTVVIAVINGFLIGLFDRMLTRFVRSKAIFPHVEQFFRI